MTCMCPKCKLQERKRETRYFKFKAPSIMRSRERLDRWTHYDSIIGSLILHTQETDSTAQTRDLLVMWKQLQQLRQGLKHSWNLNFFLHALNKISIDLHLHGHTHTHKKNPWEKEKARLPKPPGDQALSHPYLLKHSFRLFRLSFLPYPSIQLCSVTPPN